jgi:hypothetical protein
MDVSSAAESFMAGRPLRRIRIDPPPCCDNDGECARILLKPDYAASPDRAHGRKAQGRKSDDPSLSNITPLASRLLRLIQLIVVVKCPDPGLLARERLIAGGLATPALLPGCWSESTAITLARSTNRKSSPGTRAASISAVRHWPAGFAAHAYHDENEQ